MASAPNAPPPSYDQAAGSGYTNPQFDMTNDPYRNQAAYPPPGSAAGGYPTSGYPPPQGVDPKMMGYNTQYSSYPQPTTTTTTSDPTSSAANQDSTDAVSGFRTSSFSDKAIRRAFIRKVYLILMAQLLVTVGFICIFIFVRPVKMWVQGPGAVCYYVSYATFLVTYFVLVCCPSVRRKYPGNFICLAVFTVVLSYMTATISSFYDTNIVLIAMGVTAAVCLAITIFAIQTKIDFTMCSGLLFALVMVLFFFGWSCLIVYLTVGYSRILDCVYGGLAALVFSLFLIYDTQMLMGGKKYELSEEEYIFGALQLYLDIVYLFLIILSLFGKSN